MAGRGPAPGRNPAAKAASQRRHRIKPTPPMVIMADGQKHGPELPESYEWPAATLRWWEIWRTSPQAQQFTDTDWSFLIDTAVLHAEFWSGDRSVAAELRLRVAKFGATPEDRARLKFEVGDPGAVGAPTRLARSRYRTVVRGCCGRRLRLRLPTLMTTARTAQPGMTMPSDVLARVMAQRQAAWEATRGRAGRGD
jgi:hypothetical protein